MSKKFFIALITLISLSLNHCDAEQAAANSYREIFRSGNFYVEYKDKFGTRILAGKKGARMGRMYYAFENSGVAFLNPLGMFFGDEEKNPEVLYRDGNFYQFVESDKADVCNVKNLHDENLDPRQGWNKISQRLAIPDELAIFFWEDSFRQSMAFIDAPKFQRSFAKSVGNKSYDCDRYTCEVKTTTGGDMATLIYDVLYKEGKIFRVESFISRGGNDYPLNVLEVKKLQAEIPKGMFKIYKGTKLYAARAGDINDLLENPAQIGTLEEETF